MNLPKRKPNRLENYDYGHIGYYFVTLCTQNRKSIFKIENIYVGNGLCAVPQKDFVPCLPNKIIHKWIKETENKFNNIKIDKYVIMPDHIHFIVNISERHTGRSLQDAMHFFKTMTTNEYITGVKNNMLPPFYKRLWQKSYYDHIIRNQNDYNETWEYIDNNPMKWMLTHKTNQGD